MSCLLLILFGIIGGIAGGMGMGGGTILIPLVTIFLNITQKQAQLLNIASFVIMASIIIIFHLKNKLIEVFPAIIFAVFGVIASFISAKFVSNINGTLLKTLFAIFLILFSIIQLFVLTIKHKQKH